MTANSNISILFVDDEETILEIATDFFEHKGYKVMTARDGMEALEILKSEKVDCCFTDINMPRMDGMELAEHIRIRDNTLPVIVMTGYPSLDVTIKTLKNGVVDFLIKPVKLDQMELCVRRVLRQRDVFVENILLKKEVQGKERIERLNRKLRSKVDELGVLNSILAEFTNITSGTDVFKRIVEMATNIVGADESRFFAINEEIEKPFEVAAMVREQAGQNGHPVMLALSEEKAREKLVKEVAADAIPLLLPGSTKDIGLTEDGSGMFVPLKIREKVFGVLTSISFGKNGHMFTEKDLYYLSFLTQNAANAIENMVLYENIYENLFATLYAFVNALEARDPYTQQHSNRVAGISMTIGKELGCSPEELETLNFAGLLHDIGKIGIRDDILLKPGRLTDEEFEKIKEHPAIGARIVERLGLWDTEKQIIRSHHERFDGTGFPDGLQGEEIPLMARIMSVADVFDAMASNRAYRKKMGMDQVLRIIEEGSGSQFDPQVVKPFLRLCREGKISPESD